MRMICCAQKLFISKAYNICACAKNIGWKCKLNSLRKKTLMGMQWSLMGTVGNSVLQMVVMVVITRLIAPEEFGVLAMAQLFVQFATFFANFGVGTAMLRKKELTDEDMAAGFWCGMAISAVIALIMFFLAPYSTYLLDSPKMVTVVRLLSLNFVINGLGIVSLARLQRQMRFGFLALVTIGSYVLGYGLVGIPLALKGYGAFALVYCMLLQTAIRFGAQFIAAHHRICPPRNKGLYQEILAFGGQHSFAGFLSFLGSSVDRFMLGRWGGAETLGIYSRSSQLINYPIQFLSGSVTRVLFPGFSSIQKDVVRMQTVFLSSLSMMSFVLVPVACFASLTSRDLILLAFGDQWVTGWPALTAYAWIAPLSVLSMMGMIVNDIIGKQIYRIRIHLEALVIFVVTIWFGLRFGLKGVALAVVCGHAYRFVFTEVLVGRLLLLRKMAILRVLGWPVATAGIVSLIPLAVLCGCGDWSVGVRLSSSVLGSGLLMLLFIICVPVPPLVNMVEMLEEGYPVIKLVSRWIRRK